MKPAMTEFDIELKAQPSEQHNSTDLYSNLANPDNLSHEEAKVSNLQNDENLSFPEPIQFDKKGTSSKRKQGNGKPKKDRRKNRKTKKSVQTGQVLSDPAADADLLRLSLDSTNYVVASPKETSFVVTVKPSEEFLQRISPNKNDVKNFPKKLGR